MPDQTVTLDGVNSTGDIVGYEWKQVSGPSVTLSSTNTVKTTFKAPSSSSGTLVFQLTVTDGTGASSTDMVSIKLWSSGEGCGCSLGGAPGDAPMGPGLMVVCIGLGWALYRARRRFFV
jgi:chitinase